MLTDYVCHRGPHMTEDRGFPSSEKNIYTRLEKRTGGWGLDRQALVFAHRAKRVVGAARDDLRVVEGRGTVDPPPGKQSPDKSVSAEVGERALQDRSEGKKGFGKALFLEVCNQKMTTFTNFFNPGNCFSTKKYLKLSGDTSARTGVVPKE